MAGVYWNGADGNTYMRGTEFPDVTKWIGPYKTPQQLGYELIEDPNPPQVSAPVGDGSGGTNVKPLNQAAVNNTQGTIDQLPALLRDALAVEGTKYRNAESEFDAQEAAQNKTYGESTTTNQLNYDANFMDSIRSGIKGLGGLMNLLRGTGAAGGTAEDLVRDEVGQVTAGDIRTGSDTQKENQTSLDTVLSNFLGETKRKRAVNKDTYENNERAVKRDTNTQLQELYGKMAGYYSDAGNDAEYNNWMTKAGGLTPEIARDSRTAVSAYDTTPVAVQAPKVTAFSGPTQPSVLAPTNEGQVGAGLFTMSDRRRNREIAPPLVPVGA